MKWNMTSVTFSLSLKHRLTRERRQLQVLGQMIIEEITNKKRDLIIWCVLFKAPEAESDSPWYREEVEEEKSLLPSASLLFHPPSFSGLLLRESADEIFLQHG